VNQRICAALGYPVPRTFKKSNPRFPGQNFDKYTQKSNNLQIWNEEIEPTRRYVIIRISSMDTVERVKVVTGDTLGFLDTTGALTQKYQARLIPRATVYELISATDTDPVRRLLAPGATKVATSSLPTAYPRKGELLPIQVVGERLRSLINSTFSDQGADQERNRGGALHELVCRALGYGSYVEDGRFPDVKHQLLEVKLQTSPTIDLGLVTPDSSTPLDIPQPGDVPVRHCDVRYALFHARTDGISVTLTHLFLTTGRDFFSRFPRFEGKVLNSKLQIPLPTDFFEG
jgi:hypothetical protein